MMIDTPIEMKNDYNSMKIEIQNMTDNQNDFKKNDDYTIEKAKIQYGVSKANR